MALLDLLKTEVLINEEDCHVEGFGHQPELAVHIYDPLDEESARGVFHFGWQLDLREKVGLQLITDLRGAAVCKNMVRHFCHALGVAHVELVGKAQCLVQLLLVGLETLTNGLAHSLGLALFFGGGGDGRG